MFAVVCGENKQVAGCSRWALQIENIEEIKIADIATADLGKLDTHILMEGMYHCVVLYRNCHYYRQRRRAD